MENLPNFKVENPNKEKEGQQIDLEISSLEKGFGYFNSVRRKDNGFEVVLPGLINENGSIVGGAIYKFNNWDEAKEFYLQEIRSREKIITDPILEIEIIEGENMAFSDFDKFNPIISPRNSSQTIPESAQKYILNQEKYSGGTTYKKTIEDKDWGKNIFSFISNYLETDNGKKILEKLKIKDIYLLTPKKAIDLTSEIVVNLTKYNYQEETSQTYTTSDNSTALELLNSGLKNKEANNWAGNGVCRNFTSITKAVFESLKKYQTEYNFLRDTYCIYNGGNNFKPQEYNNPNSLNIGDNNEEGHAWNTFITISEGKSNATVIDTTWAKRNLETKQIENINYTIDRTSHIVNNILSDFNNPEKLSQNNLQKILDYYEQFYKVKTKEDLKFYSCFLVKILAKFDYLVKLPDGVLNGFIKDYMSMSETADILEIESLYKLAQTNKNIPLDTILGRYLKNKTLSNYHINKLIVSDDNLQRKILYKINIRPEYEAFFNSSLSFQNRIRDL